ncbi:MAG: alpha/beta hydrolase [Candidatus Competibacteraceae bacterium]
MLNWTILTALLVVLFMAWLSIRIFLQGPTLRDYDQVPPNGRVGSRERASPAHQEAVRRLEQATAEILAAPRKQRRATIRRVMARGFVEPSLLAGDTDYQLREVDAGGVPGEWVLAPDSDPHRRLLYLHGGSFISGCPRGHRVITTKLAQVTGASILALDYRLMPEHSRRDINADCQTGYRWILIMDPLARLPSANCSWPGIRPAVAWR